MKFFYWYLILHWWKKQIDIKWHNNEFIGLYPTFESYLTLPDAEDACSKREDCEGIYYPKCKNKAYQLCASHIMDLPNSCIYRKIKGRE